MNEQIRRRDGIAIAIVCAAPFIALVWMCARLYVDVPFWDQWELVPALHKLDAGTLRFQDLWWQHNEHRPLFPVLLMLALARMSGWNVGWEIAANVAFGIGIFLVFARYLATTWDDHGGTPSWMLPVVSTLVFSPAQWENWLWGWQISALMGVCSALCGLYLVVTADRRAWRFAAALACGVWSTYSFAAGLVYWVVGPVAIVLGAPARRRARAVAWTVVAVLTIASYFYGYVQPAQASVLSNFSSWDRFRTLLVYAATYLGAPVAAYNESAAAAVGALGALLFGLLAAGLWRFRHAPAVLFPLVVALQALGIAAISALGRAWMGSGQALASRYITIAAPFWCALAVMAVFLLRARVGPGRQRAGALLVSVVIVAVLGSSCRTGYVGSLYAAVRSEHLRAARRGLIVGQSDALMLRLYPDARVIRQRRDILRMLHMSVFRPSH